MNIKEKMNIAIIGSGVSGLVSSLILSRFELSFVIFHISVGSFDSDTLVNKIIIDHKGFFKILEYKKGAKIKLSFPQ